MKYIFVSHSYKLIPLLIEWYIFSSYHYRPYCLLPLLEDNERTKIHNDNERTKITAKPNDEKRNNNTGTATQQHNAQSL